MQVTIDGIKCECEKGEHIIDIASRNDIQIPTFCHTPSVPYQGCCRFCIVEIVEHGVRKVVASCVYPVKFECEIFTNTPKLTEERNLLMAFMNKRAPSSKDIANLTREWIKYDGLGPQRQPQDFILCEMCGKPLGTRKRFERVHGSYPDVPELCDACKRKYEARQIYRTLGFDRQS